MVTKVADIAFVRDGKVLLVQQRKKSAEGLWSYPGGRVEDGETIEEAVKREVAEELNVKITKYKPLCVSEITTSVGKVEINSFVGDFEGGVKLKEDELFDYGWFSLSELQDMWGQLRSPEVFEQAKHALEA